MTKKRKLLILSLFVCLSVSTLFAMESKAEDMSGEQTSSESGMKDENGQRLDELTTMDESGNVIIEEDAEAKVVESAAASRARSTITARVVNFRTKGNAVTNYTEDGTGASGYTNGAYGADAAYLGTSDGKVRFMMSGVVGWVNEGDVQVINLSDAKVVSCYEVSNGRLLHRIVTDMTTPGYATSLDNGSAPSYLSGGVSYYSYDGHYFYTDYTTMLVDYQNNVRSHSVNQGSPYYNYFQYLPFRSRTGYSDGELNGLINARVSSAASKMYNTGGSLVSQQNTYGVNALIMAGIAANESGWGNSSISQSKNNLFGLNAVDSSPGTSANTYASVDECVRQFANAWMSRGYLNPDDWRYKGGFLGNKASGLNVSYASDPYWGEKAANVMWNLDQNGGARDYGTYTIGIKDTVSTSHNSVNVRSGDNTSTTSIYKTGMPSSYAVLILDKQATNSFYRIQSDAVLNADHTAVVSSSTGEYNFDSMYAYISSDYTMVVSDGSATTPPPTPAPAPKTLDSIYISASPSKTIYTEGESFAASGMVVMARWSDGSESDVTGSVSYPTEALAIGTAEVQIQYTSEGVTQTAVQSITVKEKPTVSKVTINPASVEITAGEGFTFGVSVAGTGNSTQNVTWSVEGAKSQETQISTSGKLQVAADETAEELTVKAVSVIDSGKSAAAKVKVIAAPVKEPENPESPEQTPSTEVKDEVNGIYVNGALPEGTELKVDVIGQENETYAALTEPVAGKTILGVYDISLSKALEANQSVTLTFTIDSKYNDKNVTVLHYAKKESDTFLETYKEAVKDGSVSIEVNGFSPYVLALEEAVTEVPPADPLPTEPPTDDGLVGTPPSTSTPPANGSLGLGGAQTDDGSTPEGDQTGGDVPLQRETNVGGTPTGETAVPTIAPVPTAAPKADGTTANTGNATAPKTGDNSQNGMWGLLLIASAAGIAVMGRKKFKEIRMITDK